MQIYVNQGIREAEELVTLGDETLVEYEMPNGSTALRILASPADDRGRTASYATLPKRWLEALVAENVTWQGRPQQRTRPAPQPAELLATRGAK